MCSKEHGGLAVGSAVKCRKAIFAYVAKRKSSSCTLYVCWNRVKKKKEKKRNFDFESLVLRKFRKITAISHPWYSYSLNLTLPQLQEALPLTPTRGVAPGPHQGSFAAPKPTLSSFFIWQCPDKKKSVKQKQSSIALPLKWSLSTECLFPAIRRSKESPLAWLSPCFSSTGISHTFTFSKFQYLLCFFHSSPRHTLPFYKFNTDRHSSSPPSTLCTFFCRTDILRSFVSSWSFSSADSVSSRRFSEAAAWDSLLFRSIVPSLFFRRSWRPSICKHTGKRTNDNTPLMACWGGICLESGNHSPLSAAKS